MGGERPREPADQRVGSSTFRRLRSKGRAVVDGDIDGGSLMAGQSVGLVDRVQPMREIFKELLEEAEAEAVAVRERLA